MVRKLNQKTNSEITMTDITTKLTIKGETEAYDVARIPLNLCHYNDQNGRIATFISEYLSKGHILDKNNIEEYNDILEGFIYKSNPIALNDTKKNIDKFGQKVPGVVLNDGRIIDGNRRFTALRKLNKDEGKDLYFEAIILDKEQGLTERDIKRLELNLQHGEEKPVDYNPIDNLVDVYRDLIKNNLFTQAEYADSINQSSSQVRLMMKKAELMVQFLEFINAKEKYYIVRELSLDGPLQEMVSILEKDLKGIDVRTVLSKDHEDKTEQAEYIKLRDSLFTSVLSQKKLTSSRSKGDLTREIREIGKHIVNSDNRDEFLEEFDPIVDDIYNEFHKKETENINDFEEVGKQTSELRREAQEVINNHVEDTKIENIKTEPLDIINKVFRDLSKLELDQVKLMSKETRSDFIKISDEVKQKLNELDEGLDV